MADPEYQRGKTEAKVHNLFAAIERVRNAQAERADGVAEIEQAARARLEMLAQDLRPVFNDVPKGNEQFEFALSGGETPRLWIDMTAFVRIGRDRRTYEFVKDTRLGRVVLGETDNRGRMAQKVTDYVAERILERERAIEGDWVAMKSSAPTWRRQGRANGRVAPIEGRWPAWALVAAFVAGAVLGAAWLAVWLQAR